jgi:hypothetical protein
MMRKGKREQKDFFQKLERGEGQDNQPKEPKLLARKIKDVSMLVNRVLFIGHFYFAQRPTDVISHPFPVLSTIPV